MEVRQNASKLDLGGGDGFRESQSSVANSVRKVGFIGRWPVEEKGPAETHFY